MSHLRGAVEGRLIVQLQSALKRFCAAAPGQFPAAGGDLAAYFDPPVDPALLARWKVVPVEPEDVEFKGPALLQPTPVDAEWDRTWFLGLHGYGSGRIEPKENPAPIRETPGTGQ